ncbi:MAG: glycoside hydrolase family 20 [Flavobacteriaceae bacterium]|nr:MAG: glycoside hydrolase family 20 [Flavobacteriaceae bacterium]
MKKHLLTYCIVFFTIIQLVAQEKVDIIPQPNNVVLKSDLPFDLSKVTIIKSSKESKEIAKILQNQLKNDTNQSLKISKKQGTQFISFLLNDTLAKEAYELNIDTQSITITAAGNNGWFYGIQSLRQLAQKSIQIPTMTIKDSPRFSWRAYMLDESRYFHGEEFVKLLLDQMALLKMNVFHWHLVDDGGWRIEIKKYPKLTSIGSKRKDSEIETWGSGKYSGEPHEGFYTQKQIKNIVAYAADRNITIVPEFEMPGHSSAAIASYPWLGTLGKEMEVPVKFGRLYDNYDVTKPEVITFIHDVLTEIFALFPSKVIHIGGDEVGYKVWEESESVQQYMQENNIATPADLQIQFTNNISQFIEKNGRRMMGWNEIMGTNIHKGFAEKKDDKEAETTLAKNVVVHFWKGNIDLLTKAAREGYGIVNSLHSNTYLDYSHKSISLEKAYNFNPIPKDLAPEYHKNVYGLGCQMWSEWTPTNADIERQTYPRIAAFAEVGWTQTNNKDFNIFSSSLEQLKKHWSKFNINFYNNK